MLYADTVLDTIADIFFFQKNTKYTEGTFLLYTELKILIPSAKSAYQNFKEL